MPAIWPMPAAAYDTGEGTRVYQGMIERIAFVEQLGFDWVSLSEHHYSPRILTPSPQVAAAYVAARVHKIKIALLGPIVSHSNPVRIAEELAMLDTMADGRLVVGLLRGTPNETLTYDLNPQEIPGTDRRGHGADPEGVDRTAALRLAGPPLPLSHGLGVAASAAAAAPANLRARHQPGGGRVRGPQPDRAWRLLRTVRGHGQGDRPLPRPMCAPRLATRHPIRSSSGPTSFWARPMRRHNVRWRLTRRGRHFLSVKALPVRCWNWTPATSPARSRPASINRRCRSTLLAGPTRSSIKSDAAAR